MRNSPKCVRCHSEYTYEDGAVYICPECGHEWPIDVMAQDIPPELSLKDAHGNILLDGDNITIIKNIRVVEGADGHNIDAKVPGFGPMMLKSEFVKKSN